MDKTVNDLIGVSTVQKHTNLAMAKMLASMEPFMQTATGLFGYAIARNTRKIRDACTEYLNARESLICELGEADLDDNGQPTGCFTIKTDTDAFVEFSRRIGSYANIEHDVDLFMVPYNALPKQMTAREMFALDWMIYDSLNYSGTEG